MNGFIILGIALVCGFIGGNQAQGFFGGIPAGGFSSSSSSSSSSSIGPDGRPVTITKTHTTGDATAFATGSAVDPNDPGNYAGSASLSASAPGRDPVLQTQKVMSGSGIAEATATADEKKGRSYFYRYY